MVEIKDSDKFRIQIASTILASQVKDKIFNPSDPAVDRYVEQAFCIADKLITAGNSDKNFDHA